ncbi:MAG: hypothetical protein ACYDCL_11500 [Myxococcales bacterium]
MLLALGACASDPCGDGASATQNVASYIAGCAASDPTFFGGYSPCFDQAACEANLKACTEADRSILEAIAKCQNTYAQSGACTLQADQTEIACATGAETLADGGSAFTPACAAAFTQNQGTCALADAGA